MGVILPKPVLSKVIERVGNKDINAAVCTINGFRNAMEDAHMLLLEGDRYLFGVFDGHSNDKCSAFVSEHLPGRIKSQALPLSDLTLEKLCLELDDQFLEDVGDGGTTATFCIVEPKPDGSYDVTVCNIGDSRTLIVRDGTILFATEDHKPGNPGERARIEKAGGSVRMNRVDGDLAVSRAFGDAPFKKPREDPRNCKVIAVPDVRRFKCQKGDQLVICCDGVFEGSFTNDEVASFVNAKLPPPGNDMATIAGRVCDQAVRRGSKDNITCMVVSFSDGSEAVERLGTKAFVPGAPFPRNHEASRNVYAKMAAHAGMTTAEALELRYTLLQHYLNGTLSTLPPVMHLAFEMSDEIDIEGEKQLFGDPGQDPKRYFQAFADGTLAQERS